MFNAQGHPRELLQYIPRIFPALENSIDEQGAYKLFSLLSKKFEAEILAQISRENVVTMKFLRLWAKNCQKTTGSWIDCLRFICNARQTNEPLAQDLLLCLGIDFEFATEKILSFDAAPDLKDNESIDRQRRQQ